MDLKGNVPTTSGWAGSGWSTQDGVLFLGLPDLSIGDLKKDWASLSLVVDVPKAVGDRNEGRAVGGRSKGLTRGPHVTRGRLNKSQRRRFAVSRLASGPRPPTPLSAGKERTVAGMGVEEGSDKTVSTLEEDLGPSFFSTVTAEGLGPKGSLFYLSGSNTRTCTYTATRTNPLSYMGVNVFCADKNLCLCVPQRKPIPTPIKPKDACEGKASSTTPA